MNGTFNIDTTCAWTHVKKHPYRNEFYVFREQGNIL